MLNVGIIGSGFVAKLRSELFHQRPDTKLIGFAGAPDRVNPLADQFNCLAFNQIQDLVSRDDVDLIVVANVNAEHAKVVRMALESGKHVVVEYPLALQWQEGNELWELSQAQNKLLHIEHIELLGGVHQAMVSQLPTIGTVDYVQYTTKSPQRHPPNKWTYQPDRYGFPLTAALSRIHRLTAVWGEVTKIFCQLRYTGDNLPDRFSSCYCQAQLEFACGILADIHYSKGANCWQSSRVLEVQGSKGGLFFSSDAGTLMTEQGEVALTVGTSRGLFQIDTNQIVAHLLQGTPLYTHPSSSLLALKVSCAAERSVATGKAINLAELL
ncbi:MAG: Gfo/Idh/MocA family protein [Burkholderiales bacterium]